MGRKMVRKIGGWGAVCYLTYLTAYLCRINFSAALTPLSAALHVPYDVLGAAGAAFFAVYAVGQLINGFLGDHIHPARFILAALAGTAICNAGVAFASRFEVIFLLWAANGYFQSIFWSTIIRLLSMVTSEEERGATSAVISAAPPIGYMISWCLLAPCFDGHSVRLFFLAPVFAALPLMLLWRGKTALPLQSGAERLSVASLRAGVAQTWRIVRRERMALILAALIFQGLIKEGIAFWIPTIIRGETGGAWITAAALTLMPAANVAGTMLAKRLLARWGEKPCRVVCVGFMAMLPMCAALTMLGGVWVLLPMCVISCLAYNNNTVLLSFVPMRYQRDGVVASLVGLFDFFAYMGAAVSAYVLGGMVESAGVHGMALIWGAAACMGLLLLGLQEKRSA